MTIQPNTSPDVHTQSMYWDTYTEEQQRALLSLPNNDLGGEITLLRILILHLLRQEMKNPPSDPGKGLSSLHAKCGAALAIASMQILQAKEHIAHPWYESILAEAYYEARREMGILNSSINLNLILDPVHLCRDGACSVSRGACSVSHPISLPSRSLTFMKGFQMRNRHAKTPRPPVKRRRGAQPGNSNAYKHGFYSSRLPPADLQSAEKHRTDDLQADIDMVTVSIDNFLRSGLDPNERTWERSLLQLRAVTLAVAAKASLLRIQSNMQTKLAGVKETGAWLESILSEDEPETDSSSGQTDHSEDLSQPLPPDSLPPREEQGE